MQKEKVCVVKSCNVGVDNNAGTTQRVCNCIDNILYCSVCIYTPTGQIAIKLSSL